MKLLLFGFAPFAGDGVNPSELAVLELARTPVAGIDIAACVLPVSFRAMPGLLRAAIDAHRPDAVLGLGLAAGRAELAIERVALNLIDARIPDNDGAQPMDLAVQPDGPAALFAGVPVKAMVQAVRAAGVPATLSLSAGSFACNAAFYLACRQVGRGGFIHLPCLPAEAARTAGTPSMALAVMITGLRAALAALRDVPDDITLADGALH